jgi:hypothetical protein
MAHQGLRSLQSPLKQELIGRLPGALAETPNEVRCTQPRRLDMRNPTSFAIVLFRNEILEQAPGTTSEPPKIRLRKDHCVYSTRS